MMYSSAHLTTLSVGQELETLDPPIPLVAPLHTLLLDQLQAQLLDKDALQRQLKT